MRANLNPSVSLDFLDGYLFRVMQEIATRHGISRSGFYNYYRSRLDDRIGGLIEYEAALGRWLIQRYPSGRIVHAGIGIGTLACALACNGMTVVGVESSRRRVRSAHRLREAVVSTWPSVRDRYHIVDGSFPAALTRSSVAWWRRRRPPEGMDSGAILLFTNVANTWGEPLASQIFGALSRYSAVVLDLRLFGKIREDETERMALFDRIAANAREAEHIPAFSGLMHLAHFTFGAAGTAT